MWGSVATSGGAPNWGGDSSIWGDSTNSNMGFWDEAVKEVAQPPPQAPPPARKPNAQKNNKANANLRYNLGTVLQLTPACLFWLLDSKGRGQDNSLPHGYFLRLRY